MFVYFTGSVGLTHLLLFRMISAAVWLCKLFVKHIKNLFITFLFI